MPPELRPERAAINRLLYRLARCTDRAECDRMDAEVERMEADLAAKVAAPEERRKAA